MGGGGGRKRDWLPKRKPSLLGKAWYMKYMAAGRRSYPGQVASAGAAGVFWKVHSMQLVPGSQQLGTGKSKQVVDPEQAAWAVVIQRQVSHPYPGKKGSLTRAKQGSDIKKIPN